MMNNHIQPQIMRCNPWPNVTEWKHFGITGPLWGGNYQSLSGVPDYFDRNKISSGGDLFHYSSASLY